MMEFLTMPQRVSKALFGDSEKNKIKTYKINNVR